MTDEEMIWATYAGHALNGIVAQGEAASRWPARIAADTADAMLAEHRRRYPVAQGAGHHPVCQPLPPTVAHIPMDRLPDIEPLTQIAIPAEHCGLLRDGQLGVVSSPVMQAYGVIRKDGMGFYLKVDRVEPPWAGRLPDDNENTAPFICGDRDPA